MNRTETFHAFDEMPEEARQLAAAMAQENPFVADFWLQNFDKHLLRENERPDYIVFYEGDTPAVILPLRVTVVGRTRLKKLTLSVNFYTTFFCLPRRPDLDIEIYAERIARHLFSHYKKYALFEFAPLRKERLLERLSEVLKDRYDFRIRRYECHKNLYENVSEDDFDSYWQRRPSQLKNTYKRKLKQFSKMPDARMCIIDSVTDLESGFKDYEEVYRKSWKSAEYSSDFIFQVTASLLTRRQAKLGLIYIGDQPAAAQIWFRINTAWAVFKLAYDPAFSKMSVGTILTVGLLKAFFDEGATSEIDFLSGDDEYKKDWVAEQRIHFGIEAINRRSLLGRILSIKRAWRR